MQMFSVNKQALGCFMSMVNFQSSDFDNSIALMEEEIWEYPFSSIPEVLLEISWSLFSILSLDNTYSLNIIFSKMRECPILFPVQKSQGILSLWRYY